MKGKNTLRLSCEVYGPIYGRFKRFSLYLQETRNTHFK